MPAAKEAGRAAGASSHDHTVLEGHEQRVVSQPDTLLSHTEALGVAQIGLEEEHLLDPLDSIDRSEELEQGASVEVHVERPSSAIGATLNGVDVAVQCVDDPLAHEVK